MMSEQEMQDVPPLVPAPPMEGPRPVVTHQQAMKPLAVMLGVLGVADLLLVAVGWHTDFVLDEPGLLWVQVMIDLGFLCTVIPLSKGLRWGLGVAALVIQARYLPVIGSLLYLFCNGTLSRADLESGFGFVIVIALLSYGSMLVYNVLAYLATMLLLVRTWRQKTQGTA